MAEQTGRSSYFMEIYDRIHSVDLVLRGSDRLKEIEIHPNKIVLKNCDDNNFTYLLVVDIEPTSCTSIREHPKEGIGLRLQIREIDTYNAWESQKDLTDVASEELRSGMNQMKLEVCQCICKTCGLPFFVNNMRVQRVLPLPSESWKDLYNNWSCCSHSGKVAPAFLTDSVLRPKEGDCFLDDFNLLVHATAVESKNISFVKCNNQSAPNLTCVKCARCRAVVGEAITDDDDDHKAVTYKFNKIRIKLFSVHHIKTETVFRPLLSEAFFLERILAERICDAVHRRSTHLFMIQDQNSNIYLLLRVLNTGSRLFIKNAENYETGHFSKAVENEADAEDHKRSLSVEEASLLFSGNVETSVGTSKPGDLPVPNIPLPLFMKDQKKVDLASTFLHKHHNKVQEDSDHLLSFSPHLSLVDETCDLNRDEETMNCKKIVKMMYANTYKDESRSELRLKWLRDERTSVLSYPAHICVHFMLLLLSSTVAMPVANRNIDDFLIGYLRYG